MDFLNSFLRSEINSKDLYVEILHFIKSNEIRKGEFEGNDYIILKLNRECFILYPEYCDKNGTIDIPYAKALCKKKLLEEIDRYAKSKKII